ncbi:MAG: zinc ABC transporter substrate-binding protein [Deltaproteobacteria bacterium]|nr:zinc ABC transporter substrate-binding protein [Deltaproteobacteria bacterium]
MKRLFLLLIFFSGICLFPFYTWAKLKIVATIFPFYDFARQIVEKRGETILIVKPGVDLHHFEPKPSDILALKGADFFVFGGTWVEPWTEKIVRSVRSGPPELIDLSEELELKTTRVAVKDPHIWLDFSYVAKMIDKMAKSFAKRDKENSDFYLRNGEAYKEKIRALDQKYKESLASCKIKTIVHAGHYSFGYLAERYNLNYIAAYPQGMESEPKASQLKNMKEVIKRTGAKYIFYEELVNPKVASIISRELKLGMLKLNPGGNVPKKRFDAGITFLEIMEENLESLNRGLECK